MTESSPWTVVQTFSFVIGEKDLAHDLLLPEVYEVSLTGLLGCWEIRFIVSGAMAMLCICPVADVTNCGVVAMAMQHSASELHVTTLASNS